MHLSRKQKDFSAIFFLISQIYIIFWTFSNKYDSISTAAPLLYSLITVKVIKSEKVTLSDMQSLKTVC